MSFRELEYVIAIARTQSIGQAAKDLNVSQPTLSKFVQTLENSLGQPIFSKQGNRFFLTYAGERYVESAKTILRIKKELDSELSDIKNEEDGELKVAFRMCGGINILPRLISRFWQQYPKIRISVLENGSNNIEESLLNGDVDLAFITLPVKSNAITYETLSHEEVLPATSPENPLARKYEIRQNCRYPWFNLSDAENENFILQQPGHKTRQVADDLLKSYKVNPNIALTVSNIDIIMQLVSSNQGMTFAGEVPLSQIQTEKPLAYFSVGEPCTEFRFAVAYRNGMYLSSCMKLFINLAKSLMKDPHLLTASYTAIAQKP